MSSFLTSNLGSQFPRPSRRRAPPPIPVPLAAPAPKRWTDHLFFNLVSLLESRPGLWTLSACCDPRKYDLYRRWGRHAVVSYDVELSKERSRLSIASTPGATPVYDREVHESLAGIVAMLTDTLPPQMFRYAVDRTTGMIMRIDASWGAPPRRASRVSPSPPPPLQNPWPPRPPVRRVASRKRVNNYGLFADMHLQQQQQQQRSRRRPTDEEKRLKRILEGQERERWLKNRGIILGGDAGGVISSKAISPKSLKIGSGCRRRRSP